MLEMKLNLTKITKLIELGVSIDEYVLLYSKFYSLGWTKSVRFPKNIYESLKEKEYLSKRSTLTKDGKKFVELIDGSIPDVGDFEELWKIFPSNDAILHFKPTRTLKTGKNNTKIVYNMLLKSGVTHKFIMEGLNNMLESKLEESKKKGTNSFTYIPNIERWLREKRYENWQYDSNKQKVNIVKGGII